VQAAGLDPVVRASAKKIDNSVFRRDLEAHLERYKPKELINAPAREPWKRTLIVGDLHAPFANVPLLEKIYRFAEREKPEIIVQIGDLYDFLAHGRFSRSVNDYSPRQEQELGRKQAEEMWAELRKASPAAQCYQLWGNHDARPLKRILEVYPEAEDWVNEMITRLMTFEGVKTMDDTREELILPGNVMAHHGYRSRLGQHRDYAMMNAVVGHTHTGGVVFKQIRGEVLWELNVGFAADANSKGLSYTNQRMTAWTPGFGWIDQDGPRFIPFK